ncbi:MAG: hypothetical protein AMXMBFR76_05420 [Pseudomonadota bacterium]|jgi:5-methylcytosine-specific restriction endonuclease McrA
MPPPFDVAHEDAFETLGALPRGRQWSAFDVPMERARAGDATRLVTTIWNFHVSEDEGGQALIEKAICEDTKDRTLWYRTAKPPLHGSRTWTAHWNRVQLALEKQLPIIGVLKDAQTGNCSLENLFKIDNGSRRYQIDDGSLWLRLQPRRDIGCEVRIVDMNTIICRLPPDSLQAYHSEFERHVERSRELSSAARAERLRHARVLPKRTDIVTSVFVRNPDVVAEVLFQAAGNCQRCAKPAPFNRESDGTPYLEVHHRVPLAIGGEDTVANAIALCPNCHRELHYGKPAP